MMFFLEIALVILVVLGLARLLAGDGPALPWDDHSNDPWDLPDWDDF